jgi:hypothetical protein
VPGTDITLSGEPAHSFLLGRHGVRLAPNRPKLLVTVAAYRINAHAFAPTPVPVLCEGLRNLGLKLDERPLLVPEESRPGGSSSRYCTRPRSEVSAPGGRTPRPRERTKHGGTSESAGGQSAAAHAPVWINSPPAASPADAGAHCSCPWTSSANRSGNARSQVPISDPTITRSPTPPRSDLQILAAP